MDFYGSNAHSHQTRAGPFLFFYPAPDSDPMGVNKNPPPLAIYRSRICQSMLTLVPGDGLPFPCTQLVIDSPSWPCFPIKLCMWGAVSFPFTRFSDYTLLCTVCWELCDIRFQHLAFWNSEMLCKMCFRTVDGRWLQINRHKLCMRICFFFMHHLSLVTSVIVCNGVQPLSICCSELYNSIRSCIGNIFCQ